MVASEEGGRGLRHEEETAVKAVELDGSTQTGAQLSWAGIPEEEELQQRSPEKVTTKSWTWQCCGALAEEKLSSGKD